MEPKWSLWAWSEGVEGHYLPFTMANISKLTTWARFGTFATFESRLLHQHVFVLPNSFKLIATSYMEPKWSLWAWSEGVEGHYLPFTMANISKLTTWARFGTFATFESSLLHQHVFVLPNSFKLIATSYMEPKWSLWAWSEGVEGLLPPFYNVKYL